MGTQDPTHYRDGVAGHSAPSRFDAEIEIITAYAEHAGHCPDGVHIQRLGDSSLVILTDPATFESGWRIDGCENDMHFVLDCSGHGDSYSCSAHQWPAVLVGDRPGSALRTALIEARALDSDVACHGELSVRETPRLVSVNRGMRADIERCGKTAHVEILCGGSPSTCVARRVPADLPTTPWRPEFGRAIGLRPDGATWTYWGTAGGSLLRVDGRTSLHPVVGVGAEVTSRFLVYDRFAGGVEPSLLDVAELRAGPWLSAVTSGATSAVDGGVTLLASNVFHPSWGVLGARAGVGYGAFEHRRASHAAFAFAWDWTDANKEGPRLHDRATARLVASFQPLLSSPGSELLFALEMSPSLLAH